MKLTTEEMLNKFGNNDTHSQEVARLCEIIFDKTNEIFDKLNQKDKRLLKSAALLHDIGYSIDSKSHNKHSQKLILDYGLKEFNQRETEVISCICRYHKGSLPDKQNHEIYCNFDKKERKKVKRLAGILKIADGLDNQHLNLVKGIRINYDNINNITEIYLTPNNYDYISDISFVARKKDLFEIGFKTQVVFKFEPDSIL